jgi:mannose-6-phosphate isomerase
MKKAGVKTAYRERQGQSDDNVATFILRLHQYYPDDIGLFAPLFLIA